MGYLTNFIVYTLAMVGVIMLAVLIFKTSTSAGVKASSKYLKVHDTLSLGPRKTLYIVSAGNEKFLIAGDVDKTTLISKLGERENLSGLAITPREKVEQVCESSQDYNSISFQETMQNIPSKTSYMDKSVVGIYKTQNKPYASVMKNLAERIKEVSK